MKFKLMSAALCLIFCSALAVSSEYNAVEASSQSCSQHDLWDLQSFLLGGEYDSSVAKGYDLNNDGVLDSFDLCLMRKAVCTESENIVTVSTVEELKAALAEAVPGVTILLQPGTYQTSDSGKSGSLFYSDASGIAAQPITIKSADPDNPAVLSGVASSSNMVLYIEGEYWNIENIVCCNAKKGIMLDKASYSTINNVEVYNIGEEGIHIRDGSSYCQILNSRVHDTGQLTPEYGEAVYLGSAKSTTSYSYDCNYNLVKGCTLGPNVTAEHIDVKEYTTGNIIENCTMYGGGMTDTDSFVDIKGNETIVRYNMCDAQENTTIADAFQVHCQVGGWGVDNLVHGNSVTFTGDTEYVVRLWSGTSCTVYENTRYPENSEMMYRAYSGSTITEQ